MSIFDRLKFPTQDAKKVGAWAFNKLKPPVKDIATIGRALPKVSSPSDAYFKILSPVKKFGKGVGEFTTSSVFGDVRKKGVAGIPEHTWEVEKDLLKIPLKFSISTLQAFKTLGKIESKPFHLPILGDINTYQKDAHIIFNDVIDGKRPLYHALIPFVEVPIDASIMTDLLSSGARNVMRGIKVNSSETAIALKTMGLTDISETAQKSRFRELAREFHPDKIGVKSDKLMKELNKANDILNKAREEGILIREPSKIAHSIRNLSEAGLSKPSEIRKIFEKRETPFIGVKGLLPEQAGTIPTRPLRPKTQPMGLSIRDIEAKPIKSSDIFLNKMRKSDTIKKTTSIAIRNQQIQEVRKGISELGFRLETKLESKGLSLNETLKTKEELKDLDNLAQDLDKGKLSTEDLNNIREDLMLEGIDVGQKVDITGVKPLDEVKTLTQEAPKVTFTDTRVGEEKTFESFAGDRGEVISETKPIETKLLTTPNIEGKDFIMQGLPKRKGYNPATKIKREVAKNIKEVAEKKATAEVLKTTKKGLSGFDNFIDITEIEKKTIPYKKMNIAENIVGDKTFPAIRKSGFYADKEIQSAPIRDIYDQKLSPHLMALKQDDYKLGGKFGTVFSKIWKPTEKAIRAEKEFNSKNVKTILDLGKKYKIKVTKKNLEHLSDVIEKKVKATTNEELYIKELRKTLDGLREEANTVREAMGKSKMGYIENYIPHIQKANIWSELLANDATISDNLDFIIPNQTKNPFAYKRMLEEMEKPERNLYTLLDRYVGVIGKDIYYTPAIENIKAYNGVLKSREKTRAAKYWDEYIRQGLVGKQHKIDTALGIGKKSQKVLQKWNDMVNKAFLTGKVSWNIATQPLSYLMPGISEVGVKNSIKGIYKSFSKPLRQYVKENSNVLNIKSSDVHAIAVGEGRNIQSRIYRTKIDKWNDFLSMIGSIEERELTSASYIGGLERAKELGYKGDDALWFADLSAAKSQSMYNRENRALILNSDITRTIFPFQSFAIEMFNHVKEIATKTGGAYQLSGRQRVGKLFGLLVGLYLANKYSEILTGKSKTTVGTFVPFLGSTVVDPMIAKMKGEQNFGGRSPITVIQIGEDIIKGSKDYLEHGSTKRLRKIGVNFGLALGGIGGGGQINNLIDGIMADIDENVKNISGDTMFEVKDLESKIKAPIFGVWATKEGIEYWKPKDKTPYDKAKATETKENKEAIKKLKPTYDKIQELKKTNMDKAKAMVDELSEDEWETYKKMLSSDKSKETNKLKDKLYPKYLEIQELKKTNMEKAKKEVDSLSDEEWRVYKILKEQFKE